LLRGSRLLEGWFPPRPDWWLEQLLELEMESGPEPQALCAIYACDTSTGAKRPDADAFRSGLYYTLADTDLF